MRPLFLLSALLLVACGDADAPSADAESAPVAERAPLPTVVDTASGDTLVMGAAQTSNEVVTLTSMELGDRACYLTLNGTTGERTEMAAVEFCERDDLLGRQVTLTTARTQIQAASCEGDPACTDMEMAQLVIAADLTDE